MADYVPPRIARVRTLCESAGYEIVSDTGLHGYDHVYVTDPFGNRIELMEKVPAA